MNMNNFLSTTEESMFQLVTSIPNPAHIKDAATGKYIITNKSNLTTFNFSEEKEFVGLSLKEVDTLFMQSYWGKDFAESLALIDCQVKNTGKLFIEKNKIFKDRRGVIRFQDIYKSPIFCRSNNKKVSAILTLTFEHTDKIDLITMYNKYKEMYINKNEAICYFTRSLGIIDFFYEPLTEKELLCLLYAKLNQVHKNIAQNLHVTIKTIETHLANITYKLKDHSMQDVICFLRK